MIRKLCSALLAVALLAGASGAALAARTGPYVFPLGTDMQGYVEEGSYFCVSNAQTAVASTALSIVFSDTTPYLALFNREALGGKSMYLDFVTLVTSAAGTGGTNLQVATQVDFNGDRYSSGGSDLTTLIVNPNGNAGGSSIARVRAGAITASAKTTAARQVTGDRFLKTAIPALGDSYTMKFGGVEAINSSGPTAGVAFTSINLPKLVIPPQGSALIDLWLAGQTAASSYVPELCWVER